MISRINRVLKTLWTRAEFKKTEYKFKILLLALGKAPVLLTLL